ncbi:hypothetical protein D3C83_311320 [compost metagenome]
MTVLLPSPWQAAQDAAFFWPALALPGPAFFSWAPSLANAGRTKARARTRAVARRFMRSASITWT